MVQASFTIPALEFNANFLAQIQPFLQSADTEIVVQVRRKTKRARKNGKLPAAPNGFSTLLPEIAATPKIEPFVKKYPSQPTPEEGLKMLERLVFKPENHLLSERDLLLQRAAEKPTREARILQIIHEMDVQEPIEELLALLRP